jgi:hypothetical protein
MLSIFKLPWLQYTGNICALREAPT